MPSTRLSHQDTASFLYYLRLNYPGVLAEIGYIALAAKECPYSFTIAVSIGKASFSGHQSPSVRVVFALGRDGGAHPGLGNSPSGSTVFIDRSSFQRTLAAAQTDSTFEIDIRYPHAHADRRASDFSGWDWVDDEYALAQLSCQVDFLGSRSRCVGCCSPLLELDQPTASRMIGCLLARSELANNGTGLNML